MLDLDLDKKIRLRQAKRITEEEGSISFSSELNAILREALDKKKRK